MAPDEIFAWVEQFFNAPIPYIMSPVHAWLEAGADFEKDIKPVCERFMKKGKGAPGRLDWLNADIVKSVALRKQLPEYSAHMGNAAPRPSGIGYSDAVREKDRRWRERAKEEAGRFMLSQPENPKLRRWAQNIANAVCMALEWGRYGYDGLEATGYTHCEERLAWFKAHVRDCIRRGEVEIVVPGWLLK